MQERFDDRMSMSIVGKEDEFVSEKPEPASVQSPQVCRLRRWVKGLTLLYLVLLTAWLLLLEWRGGKEWTLSIALFVPPQCWLCPLLVLTPLCLWMHRKHCWLHLGAVGLVFFGFMNWHVQLGSPARAADLTLLSNNIADGNLPALWAFAQAQNPDIMAFQDVGKFDLEARKCFPDRFVSTNGEFILVSKLRILSAAPVEGMNFRNEPVAMRYELACGQQQSIVLYNIHMPTPRGFFLNLRADGFRKSLWKGKGIYSREAWEEYAAYWNRRIELTATLLEQLKKEQKPFLLAGDFNMPDHGALYHEFTSRFTDSFRTVGQGYGLSFPGNIDTLLAFNRPWMRIDYQFADREHWQPLSCRIEPLTTTKHLALVGRYNLKN